MFFRMVRWQRGGSAACAAPARVRPRIKEASGPNIKMGMAGGVRLSCRCLEREAKLPLDIRASTWSCVGEVVPPSAARSLTSQAADVSAKQKAPGSRLGRALSVGALCSVLCALCSLLCLWPWALLHIVNRQAGALASLLHLSTGSPASNRNLNLAGQIVHQSHCPPAQSTSSSRHRITDSSSSSVL